MKQETQQWTWNDGWLLMAVFLAGGEAGAPLYKIIGAADAINHAIPTAQQLSRALTKFVQCGILQMMEAQYIISSEYFLGLRKAYEGKGGLFASADKGLKFLNRLGVAPTLHQQIDLSNEVVTSAYKEYLAMIEK